MRPAESAKESTRIFLIATGLYFVAAASTIHLTSNGLDIAAFWPANAILVALLLAGKRPAWFPVLSAGLVANIAANLLTRGSLFSPILYGAANVLEIALVTMLLKRVDLGDSILHSTGSALRFILIAGVLGPAISGIAGSAIAHHFFGEPLLKSYLTWVASDGLGLVVFTPFFFALFRGDLAKCYVGKNWKRRVEGIGLLTLTGALAYQAFFVSARPLLFALFLPLMVVTFRVGHIGTKAAIIIVAVIGCLATMYGYGPIVETTSDPTEQAHLLQAFLAILLLTCLPVAAEVAARARLIERLNAHDQEMTNRALSDPLTGVLNRTGFEAVAESMLPIADHRSVGLVAIDFDHFKSINDQWGHHAGDCALRHVAEIFKAQTQPDHVIGRMGGDEFLILLPDSGIDATTLFTERCRQAIQSSPLCLDDTCIVLLSLSMGIATARPDESYDQLLRRADAALYEAKGAGRDTVRVAA